MLTEQLDGLLAAWRFLTVLPAPGSRGGDAAALARSTPFFPVVGLVMGLLLAAAALLLASSCPPALSAVLLVGLMAGLSGALHLDGLADTADGFASSRRREQALDIMRDSRIGAMGVLALVLLLALKAVALASLLPSQLPLVLVLTPLAGRSAILLHLAWLPYVRPTGLGSVFLAGPRRPAAVLGIILVLAVAGVAGHRLLPVLIPWGLVIVAFGLLCRRRIGGITGDTLGAVCELAEATVLCSAVVLC